MRAVRKHTNIPWVLLCIERWLKAPVQMPDGSIVERERGIPQGGVISPLLANLFLHYAFDMRMCRNFPDIPFARYADDAICHCRSEDQAVALRAALDARFTDCGLTLHPDKTKIVYCMDESRRGAYPAYKFDFLGYTFRPRRVSNKGAGAWAFLSVLLPLRRRSRRSRAGSTTTVGSARPLCIPPFGTSSDISRDGPPESIKPCVVASGVRGTGSCAMRNASPGCSPTGHCCTGMAEQWEPDDARVSRPVLRERGGASPLPTHLVLTICGKKLWLWRAIDVDGNVLDILVQSRRNA